MLGVVVQAYKSQHWPVESKGLEVEGQLGCPLFPCAELVLQGLHLAAL